MEPYIEGGGLEPCTGEGIRPLHKGGVTVLQSTGIICVHRRGVRVIISGNDRAVIIFISEDHSLDKGSSDEQKNKDCVKRGREQKVLKTVGGREKICWM